MRNTLRSGFFFLALAGAALIACGCTPVESTRGYLPDPKLVKAITVGKDTKDTVEKALGHPTTTSDWGPTTWYYVTIDQEQTAFFAPEDMSRDILAIDFDKSGTVTKVHHYSLADGRDVAFETRETPTRGRTLSLLQQIFSSVPGTPISTNPEQQQQNPGSP